MASVERTAYPALSKVYSKAELQREFSFSDDELKWVRSKSKASFHLNLAVLLKTFQLLRFFPDLADVPDQVVDFIRGELGQRSSVKLAEYKWVQQYRHMSAVRTRLGVVAFYGSNAMDLAAHHAKAMSFLLDQRADIINAVIEELTRQNYELPAYSTLNDLAERVHAQSLEAIFNQVVDRTPIEVIYRLKELLVTDFGRRQSDFNALKQAPRKPSRKHLEVLIDHLSWLEEFGDLDAIFEGVTEPKIRHFSSVAAASDVSELQDCSLPKRYTLMLALIYKMRIRARDHLAEMFIKRISTIHKRAKDELEQIQLRQRKKLELLVATLDGVIRILSQEPNDQEAGSLIREYLSPEGNLDQLRQACAEVQATGGSNYLPLLWKHFKSHRSLLFRAGASNPLWRQPLLPNDGVTGLVGCRSD